MKVLHCFGSNPGHGGHGLGDCVMFTSVLRHIKSQRPQWHNFVACGIGRESTFTDLCEKTYVLGKQPPDKEFDRVIWHSWHEVSTVYHDWPSTKTTKCISESLKLLCDWDLLRYQIKIRDRAKELASDYVKTLPTNAGFVLIHYQGNTSSGSKDLPHAEISKVCNWLIKNNYTPVILDWDGRTPLADQRTIFNPGTDNPLWERLGTGDAEKVAALMELSALNICIDSGPGKVAMAVDTPHLAVWTKHHPIHFADNALHNTTHLIPTNHEDAMRGDREKGGIVLEKFYKHQKYAEIAHGIIVTSAEVLKLNDTTAGVLTSKSFNKDYYQQHQIAGLDYLNYGKWQQDYGKWVIESLDMKGKSILDVGCACGSIAAGLAQAGGFVSGCDLSQHMIDLGKAKWPDFPLFVCDATNLHLWRDNTFDLIHSAQVFEHFKPELVPFILKEIHRVTKPNGVMFAAFDTVELFARQKRVMETEDPTHTCIQSIGWWQLRLKEAGWEFAPELLELLEKHPDSYFKKYDWPSICCRKKAD